MLSSELSQGQKADTAELTRRYLQPCSLLAQLDLLQARTERGNVLAHLPLPSSFVQLFPESYATSDSAHRPPSMGGNRVFNFITGHRSLSGHHRWVLTASGWRTYSRSGDGLPGHSLPEEKRPVRFRQRDLAIAGRIGK